PYLLNFFVLGAVAAPDAAQMAKLKARLLPYYERLGIAGMPDELAAPPVGFAPELLALMLDIRPPAVSFHFGLPDADAMAALRDAGIVVLASASNVAEARALEAAGVDAVIAQGWEAGGHRGSRLPGGPADGVGLMALLPQVVDAVGVPVIAAGGIADGRGIAAALALGAGGVQIGTAFLTCPEAATSPRHRELIGAADDRDTMFTDAVSGRAARGHKSAYALDMADLAGALPAYPAMYSLSTPIKAASADMRPEPLSFYLFGQAAALNRSLPAAGLVERLVDETQAVIARMS
ncbi:MAG: NAD(P)H-dependent flavin oxidoreductase, partial [Paracoccaceae bacterium]